MPIQLPNLDDRTYDDLVAEALNLIPTYAPEWTNYNPADPGITLIELFAYITELLIYRLDRVTDENKLAFLKLINGSDGEIGKSVDQKIQSTIQLLRTPDRAITCADFESLALAAHPQIARAYCLPNLNLLADNNTARSGYISIVIVPSKDAFTDLPAAAQQAQQQQLIAAVSDYLDERRLIATRIIAIEPIYLKIRVQAQLVLKPDAISENIKATAINKLQDFFDPLTGGQTNTGWEFGRSIYLSEVYELLDELSDVDYVKAVTLLKQLDENGSWVPETLMAIALKPNQLVDFQIGADDRDIQLETEPNIPGGRS